jgi:hypothetical protein
MHLQGGSIYIVKVGPFLIGDGSSKDQARIDIDEPLVLKADEQADFILIDVPSCKGWGYSAETLQGQKK